MYQALYRKYRPVTFTDVISQDHITGTLRSQIMSGKTAHAYLFTGSRGTGKTTCARIFAKALNCLSPVDGDPCNECEICKAADEFALTDIIEIDAASNGSVDDARELREAAAYSPERCRYKVYIIDEVHMLSKDAFNALLKIIEEPPEHVKFIMATTELHKVLPTILSRCQRFDFMRIRTEDIADRIKYVAGNENLSIDDDSAQLIAKAADGGMRDALSILDRCIAFGGSIDVNVVSEATGIAGREYVFDIVRSVADEDPSGALEVISRLYDRSKDMQRLCEELTVQFRNLLILISSPHNRDIILCLPSEMQILEETAAKLSAARVLDIIDSLGRCMERMRRAMSKRIELEVCIIKLCTGIRENAGSAAATPAVTASVPPGLESRLTAIEKKLAGAVPQVLTPAEQGMILKTAPTDIKEIKNWNTVAEEIGRASPPLRPHLAGSWGYTKGTGLLINSRNIVLKGLIGKQDHLKTVLDTVSTNTGFKLERVLVGYKAELDRSGQGAAPAEEKEGSMLEDIMERAKSGGVEVVES
ncbi:MAG: DNA polymerase III subunit gamma/tau [Oscillospiraceae bacterium]|nr:DNA polymerase III subunit gamma/tau [Oscillospiraceae bacterium]